MGLGALDTSHPLWLGMLGMHGTYTANMVMANADLMIAIGARFDDRVTGKLSEFAKNCKIIHIDIDPTSIRKNVHVDVPIVGDVKRVLAQLNAEVAKIAAGLARGISRNGTARSPNGRRTIRSDTPRRPTGGSCRSTPSTRFTRLTEALRPHRLHRGGAAPDVGRPVLPERTARAAGSPRAGWGPWASGFPAAMGAQAAFPDRLVIDIDGDGSFQMTMQDLITCVQYQLPVKVFIINNRYLGMVRQWQELFYGEQVLPGGPGGPARLCEAGRGVRRRGAPR